MNRRPRTLLALVLASFTGLQASCVPLECSEVGCESGISLRVALKFDPGLLQGATAEVCRNAVCLTGTLEAGKTVYLSADPADEHAQPVAILSSIAVEEGEQLHLQWADRAEDLAPGDRYTLRVTSASGEPLIDVDRTTQYETVAPNGEACGPVCTYAQLPEAESETVPTQTP